MYSIGAVLVEGPNLSLRYATLDDAPALYELASAPAVTRFFSWGPYTSIEQPRAYIESLQAKREAGTLLDFVIVHRVHGPVHQHGALHRSGGAGEPARLVAAEA